MDAHGYGKRFVVRADEILTAFLELESAIGKQKPRAGSPARGFEVLFFLFSALADLSAGDCPTEFSQLGGVGDLRDGPFVHPKLRESLDYLPGNLSCLFCCLFVSRLALNFVTQHNSTHSAAALTLRGFVLIPLRRVAFGAPVQENCDRGNGD